MLALKPALHDLVGSAASRTLVQLQELGVEPRDHGVRVGVVLPSTQGAARRLLAESLIDLLLRLDPLVREVVVDASQSFETALEAELVRRLPLVAIPSPAVPDYVVQVGGTPHNTDLFVDAAGWVAAIGATTDVVDDGNPIGPLGCAALGTAEVFKWAFTSSFPDRAGSLEPWRGAFSFFSYGWDHTSPRVGQISLNATLVGAGGVGAGCVRTIAALGEHVSGTLALVDKDCLSTDNLNRVSYATLTGATAGARKVDEAQTYLRQHCPNLVVTAYRMTFDAFKRRIPRRADRRYDVVVTGLDNDDARWEVQRDLPRILIDGATGRDLVARVERVEFGRYGCLGCSRTGGRAGTDNRAACDAPPDPRAPSLSFLSTFPGILAAGELIKESTGVGMLRGRFDHVFRYGPNPDLVTMPGLRNDCVVGCREQSRIAQYRQKYPDEDFLA